MTTSTTTPDINSWTARNGQVRRYINNWAELAGIYVTTYKTGNVSSVSIDDYDGVVSNRKGAATAGGKVWIDSDDALHFDYHNEYNGLLSVTEKRARIVAALAVHGITAH